jgi:hypothetical protein
MHKSICETDKYGNKHWCLNGELHKTDGPAVERANGGKSWYINGKHHRTDGPAVERADGGKTWWIDDVEYSFDEFAIEMNWTQEEIVIWKLQYA